MFNRQIFGPYFNGAAQVFADPLTAHRRLTYHCKGQVNRLLADAASEDVDTSFPAKESLLVAARLTFEMFPFDPSTGDGAQDEDVWAVLNAFVEWVDKKKVSTENLPNSQPPTEWEYSEVKPTTPPTVDYTSTCPACECNSPLYTGMP